MYIEVPKKIKVHEYRVGLKPVQPLPLYDLT